MHMLTVGRIKRKMRLDRSITLNLVQPIRRLAGASQCDMKSKRIPILMYHGVSDEPEPGIRPYYRTNTSPRRFAEQMRFLFENGYRTLDLAAAVKWLKAENDSTDEPSASIACNRRLTVRPVVITFDDGYQNFYTKAFPVLREFDFTATIFLPTGLIEEGKAGRAVSAENGPTHGSQNPKRTPLSGHGPFLTWEQVRKLRRAGITFGSHSVTHPKLIDLDWPEIESELMQSKFDIEQHLSESIATFAYPYRFPGANGTFVDRFKLLLQKAGYDCCVTTELGRMKSEGDLFRLRRLPINSCDDTQLFRAKLEGNYDWLRCPQALYKAIKLRQLFRPRVSIG
jgi:peptidoglycan/xylan/chitin deacetylase (PgdA/CDA1 family)